MDRGDLLESLRRGFCQNCSENSRASPQSSDCCLGLKEHLDGRGTDQKLEAVFTAMQEEVLDPDSMNGVTRNQLAEANSIESLAGLFLPSSEKEGGV